MVVVCGEFEDDENNIETEAARMRNRRNLVVLVVKKKKEWKNMIFSSLNLILSELCFLSPSVLLYLHINQIA